MTVAAADLSPRLLIDRRAAAEMLNVSVWVLDRYIAEGVLPTVKLPSTKHTGDTSRRVLIAVEDLRALVEKCRSGPVDVETAIAREQAAHARAGRKR
jgi:hypothetical protein